MLLQPSAAVQRALTFASTSPAAVVLTVWPSGTGELTAVREWLDRTSTAVVLEQQVKLKSELSELLLVLALYDGEAWLESNCWYAEQPLPTGPPSGPYAGAKWKQALCFRNPASRDPYVFVCDTTPSTASLWREKYSLRARLASASGNPGNSCIHLTDPQPPDVLLQRGGGGQPADGASTACDESYAYACARCLLHPTSLSWLNGADVAALPLGGDEFRAAWGRYSAWVHRIPQASDEEALAF